MNRKFYLPNIVQTWKTKALCLLMLGVFVSLQAIANHIGIPGRTVVELRINRPSPWQMDEYKAYNYYSVVQWAVNDCPRILVQNKIDKAASSVKAVFNLEQNQSVVFFVSHFPVTVDELFNIDYGGCYFFNLYLEPGDSLVINCVERFYISNFSGRLSYNQQFVDHTSWPDILSDYSNEYINFWLRKTESRYYELKAELEKKRREISRGCYKYLLTGYTYGYLNKKLELVSKYIESYEDSSSVDYKRLYENVHKLQKKVISELTSSIILNDSFIHVAGYRAFIDRYMSYQLAIKTRTLFQRYHWEPDKMLFEIADEKLPPRTRENYVASIIIQSLGFPDKKETVRPFYEKYVREYPQGQYTEGLTKAFHSRGNIAKGKQAPDFTLIDASGKLISLSSFKGKTVCLYFHKNELESPITLEETDRVLSSFPELIRVFIYSGSDTTYFYKTAKSFPGAVHLLNISWAWAKEYNVNNIIFGTDQMFYVIDKDGKMLDFLNAGSNELEYKLFKLFNKSKQPSRSDSGTLFLFLVITGVLIVFAGIAWLVIRWRALIIRKREEKKRKLIEMELRGIRAQMNPHFMFNSLSSIQNLINHSKVQEANLYLSKFADLMRLVLSNSEKSRIPVADEIKAVSTYCELERLRFDFSYNINIDSKIDIYNTEIPGMLIQPYVENAILHGINNLTDRKGDLQIRLELVNNLLKCTIEDNGIGRKASEELKSENVQKTNGFGLRLTKERIDLLNSQNGQKIRVTITDKFDYNNATGTRIEICFPLED